MQKILILGLVSCFSLTVMADDTVDDKTFDASLDQAIQKKEQENKPIVVNDVSTGISKIAQRSQRNNFQASNIFSCLTHDYEPELITFSNLKDTEFFDELTNRRYNPNWDGLTSKALSERFPTARFRSHVQDKQSKVEGVIFKRTTYYYTIVMDYAKYKTVNLIYLNKYTVPALVGMGFRSKIKIKTTDAAFQADQLVGIPALLKLDNRNTNLNIEIEELGVRSPALTTLSQGINGKNQAGEQINALISYKNQLDQELNNPNLATMVTPVIFALKLSCPK